jgi:hypothetical protein
MSEPHGVQRESAAAWFLTPTPWVGPAAYLHILYKPAPKPVLGQVAHRWRFPREFSELLSEHNGAILFSGSIAVYGVVPAGQLLNRSDPYGLPPFNIEPENESWSYQSDRFLVVGGYRQDGSRACIDRVDSRVLVFPRGAQTPIACFANVSDWIDREVDRYRTLYDREGRLVGMPEETGPPRSLDSRKLN